MTNPRAAYGLDFQVVLYTYGTATHRDPPPAELVIHHGAKLRLPQDLHGLTGKDPRVHDRLLAEDPLLVAFDQTYEAIVDSLTDGWAVAHKPLKIALVCPNGQHLSVVFAEEAAARLVDTYNCRVQVHHLDLDIDDPPEGDT